MDRLVRVVGATIIPGGLALLSAWVLFKEKDRIISTMSQLKKRLAERDAEETRLLEEEQALRLQDTFHRTEHFVG